MLVFHGLTALAVVFAETLDFKIPGALCGNLGAADIEKI